MSGTLALSWECRDGRSGYVRRTQDRIAAGARHRKGDHRSLRRAGAAAAIRCDCISEIIDRAGVGKSTFYEHFRGKDAVLLSAMQPMILTLATAASGRAARSYIRSMVEHLWERRLVARPILDSRASAIVQRRLAEAIATHGGKPGDAEGARLVATAIAAAQLAMLRCWLTGHVPATIDSMTDQVIATSRLQIDDRRS